MLKFDELFENKMWYKSIPQILNWLQSKSNKTWIWIDTETTGLGGPHKQQLTQISAIATKYNFNTNKFEEISVYDEKIKLTDETKSKYNDPDDKTKWVLSFNHYGDGGYKYKDEQYVIDTFFDWLSQFNDPFLIAQNAEFDMAMLSGRGKHNILGEVFDTKELLQLYYLPLLQALAETDPKYKELIDFIGTSERDSGLISSSMSKVGPALDIDMNNYHDALTDCRITIQMYQGIVNLLKENKDVDISNYQIERIKVKRS
ncbi:MAG: putative DnaQ-like 3'-5' exonuclease [uncultured marine phage]|uniref:Putative DnaQ-like 3'-5' exonuclease n=1 Tax=uncultured marine phage TaxID=707152 RepID=A0A8D9FRN4_9VIRU|nr:MAG: putative DnaQ-like 3'-5' exonuclease [uncultured marine phage]